MNAYTTTYGLLFRARNLSRMLAKAAAWITGIPAGILALWGGGLGKPMSQVMGNPFAINFAVSLAAYFILPRVFDFLIRRVVAAAAARQ